jgi:hypothetical protein
MIKYHNSTNNIVIAELIADELLIAEVQDALDLISDLGNNDCNRIIIKETNLNNDFFRLKSGLAGDILQKFSTYGVKLAIIGDFSKYKSARLQDFIRESNKGNQIFFLGSLDSALTRLSIK